MSVKLSISVPVYNAANWLSDFVRCLAVQSVDDAEILFVDDCSTDDSIAVLNRELKGLGLSGNSRVLRHTENMGVSKARQTLLDAAQGEYVIFADPDDKIDEGMYKGLLNKAQSSCADLVWEDFYENDVRRKQVMPENPDEMLSSLLRGKLHGALWNKLMRRDFIISAGAGFLEGRVGLCEDMDFICQVLSANPKVAYNNGCHYHYRSIAGSATHGLTEGSFASLLRVENHLSRILSLDRFSEDLTYWRKGNRLAAFLSKNVSDNFFYEFKSDVRDLSGLPTSIFLKGLYWMAARGWRPLALLPYRVVSYMR